MPIHFNKPWISGKALEYMHTAATSGILAGDGPFTQLCEEWLLAHTGSARALLTPSCTAALEMAALLTDIQVGDEIIMPSFTFTSTANAFALRGGIPVFVDIRKDSLNIDENLIEQAITPRTRCIVPMHYGGVSCEMESILDIAERRGLHVIEDAAQGIGASYKSRALGSMGDLGTYSFHETKNIQCGEGGTLLIRNEGLCERASLIREKGTNRSQFKRGLISEYGWVELGSSFLLGELSAAFLWGQLSDATSVTTRRRMLWNIYDQRLRPLADGKKLACPALPPGVEHNGHTYWIILDSISARQNLAAALMTLGIATASHYSPLHTAPAGKRLGRTHGSLTNTETLPARLLRLPLWPEMSDEMAERVAEAVVTHIYP
jgi:dTDP-4-amino-4,6-dideoxygalactose transaminase